MHIEAISILKNRINQNVLKIEDMKQQITDLLLQKDELQDLTNSIQESIRVLGMDNQKRAELAANASTNDRQLLAAIPEVPEDLGMENFKGE